MRPVISRPFAGALLLLGTSLCTHVLAQNPAVDGGVPVDASADAGSTPPAATYEPNQSGPTIPHTVCEGKKISSLEIAGQGRVAVDDIRATIHSRADQTCSDANITRDVEALWELGYFDDIIVEAEVADGNVSLVYRVKERPAIGDVVFIGNDEISESDLKEKVTLREGSILSVPEVKQQIEKLRDFYAEKGFFLAEFSYELVEGSNNEVSVRFTITEGAEVTVRRVRFVGNATLNASELRSMMQTSETGLFSFISSSNTFKRAAFDEDVDRLRALYYDRGFLTVQIAEPLVELTPDREHIDITIPIKEGPRFRVGRVRISEIDTDGNEVEPLPGRRALRGQIELNPGDWFSRSVIAQNLMDVTTYYRDRGYAKVEMTPQTELNVERNVVHIVVSIKRGPIVHIQRINITGNTKTRDAVLRREALIIEGERYSQTAVQDSKQRMMALGYFESVDVSEVDGNTPDRMILNFEVAEKPTGTFQVGAGFSSQETFLFTAQIQQQNLFGRGQSLSLNLQLSGIRQMVQLQLAEPYLYGSNYSLSISGFKMLRQLQDYNRDSTGMDLTLGAPVMANVFSNNLRLFLTYHLENVNILPATGGAFGSGNGQLFNINPFIPLANLFQDGLISSLRLSLTWDNRDNRLFPTKGIYTTASTEVSSTLLGSVRNYIRHSANARFYYPLFAGLVAKLNTNWGLITAPDGQTVPVFERYYLGGIFDLRGYNIQAIGPYAQVASSTSPNAPARLRGRNLGGNMQFYYNLEVEFPIVQSIGIRGVVFHDGGNTWNLHDPYCSQLPDPNVVDSASSPCGVDLLNLRTSVGAGFRWFSPMGPLRFEWGFPLSRRPAYEDFVNFQFTVGNAF